MFKYKRLTLPIPTDKELEYLRAQADTHEKLASRNAANIDYLAMMADVELVDSEENENDEI